MRNLVVSIHSTANGIVTGPPSGDETEWTWASSGIEESLETFAQSLAGMDTILLGRATYQDLVRKWPAVDEWGAVSDLVLRVAEKVNHTPKLVVTSTRSSDKLAWGAFEPATRLSGPGVEEKISQLKKGEGGDIITFGSPTLVQALTNAGLVDEYRILIHPVVVNEGRRLFDNLAGRTDLQLVDVTSFPGGSILVTYRC